MTCGLNYIIAQILLQGSFLYMHQLTHRHMYFAINLFIRFLYYSAFKTIDKWNNKLRLDFNFFATIL